MNSLSDRLMTLVTHELLIIRQTDATYMTLVTHELLIRQTDATYMTLVTHELISTD